MDECPPPRGLSTISGLFQRFFSGQSKDRAVTSPLTSTAASAPTSRKVGRVDITGGTAVAVAAVRLPERRSHEEQQQLELRASNRGEGGASAPPIVRQVRWVA